METKSAVAELVASEPIATKMPAAKPKSRLKKLAKGVAMACMTLFVLSEAAHMAWRLSGSNRFELVRNQDGVKIYTLKSPGSEMVQVKGIVRVHATLNAVVKFMLDSDTCKDYGCYNSHMIEQVDNELEYGTFRFNLPFPLKPREFVVRAQLHQDARTNEVLLVYAAAPDKIPPDDCCLRLTEMNNTWRFTPVGNGQVEVYYLMSMNEGGNIPDALLNWQRPKLVFGVLRGLQKFVDRPKYKDAKLDFIKE